MEPQMIKKVNITIDKLQNNKPCSLSKQGLLLNHGFRHFFNLFSSLTGKEVRRWL